MGNFQWLISNWGVTIDSVGVIGALFLNAYSQNEQAKAQRVANLLTITQNHRELWSEFSSRPELARVLDAAADLKTNPVTREEEIFVNTVILQINTAYYAMRDELIIKLEGLQRDVQWFLSLPIPKAVWGKTKLLQNRDFTRFADNCIKGKSLL